MGEVPHGGAPAEGVTVPPSWELYRRASEFEADALRDQVAELDSMRTRTMQFLAFVGATSGFLIGTALDGASQAAGPLFYVLAAPATIGVGLLLLLAWSILTARTAWFGGSVMDWHYRQSGEFYIDWLDGKGALRPDAVRFYRRLTREIASQVEANKRYLSTLRARYNALIILGITVLMLWGTITWAFGGDGAIA